MDKDTLAKRVADLEEELTKIKSAVEPVPKSNRLMAHVRRITRFLLAYWVLLSFTVAVCTVVYVKYAFEIDYFEQYRDQSTRKRLSELHRQLGDRMLARSEWEAAADAYKEALQINPYNATATSGLVKAQVFLPSPREKYAAPEVIDVKLQYLEEIYPNDYIVSFLEGIRHWQMGDYEATTKSLDQSVALNPKFPGAYLFLGYVAQNRLDLDSAIKNYRTALDLDPQNAQAHNNIGFMYLLSARYQEAVKHISRSESISPQMLTGINLGDAYRYMGDYDRAMQVHEAVLRNAKSLAADDDRYLGGEWTYNFMPLDNDDTETIKRYVWAHAREQKMAIAHFALALDHAIGGNVPAANSELGEALRLEGGRAYRAFYANKIAFLERFPKLDDRAKKWFLEQRAKL